MNLLERAIEHHRAGRLAEASRLYRRVLEKEPSQTDALYLLGLIAHQNGDQVQAIELLRQSLHVAPDQPQALNVLGLALAASGEPDEAESAFRRAIALERAPEFYNNLGNLRKDTGRLEEAIYAYQRAIGLKPDFADAHYNLANAYRARQELAEAERCFRRAVDAEPGHAHALAALGQILAGADAIPFLERALSRLPDNPDLQRDLARAWFGAGCAEAANEEYAAAVFRLRKALEIAPEWPEAHHNLGQALYNLGQTDEALGEFRCALSGPNPELPRAMIAVIIPGSPSASARDVLEARRSFADQDLPPPRASDRRPVTRDRLRVGYLSSFFHRQNWMKPVWGLINEHDRERVDVHLFSDTAESTITGDVFHNISQMSNEQAANCIADAGLDLLVDLNGYSKAGRLPLVAMHPAPVVAGWFNMYATSGLAAYDYLIGDDVVIAPEDEAACCEKIARVPGSYLTFAVSYPVPAVVDPPYHKRGSITFGSLASQYKITTEVIAAWSAILRQCPSATLLLRNSALGSAGNRDFVAELFKREGIATDRLRFDGPADHHEFLRTYDDIDIALDTFPYNGGTTTTEAIWQGVPVITFHGDRWAARTSASILRAGGLGEFVAADIDTFIALAARWAARPDDLADLRRTMRSRLLASSVCDTREFARNMERLYMTLSR